MFLIILKGIDLNSIFKYLTGDRCHRLTKYYGRDLKLRGPTLEAIPNLPISIGEFSTEIQNIDSISEMAKIADDCQLHIWKILSTMELTDEQRLEYNQDLIALILRMAQLDLAFTLFRQDSKEHNDKVNKSYQELEKLVDVITTKQQIQQRRQKAISDAFSSIGGDEKEANRSVIAFATGRSKTRLWTIDNLDAQVRQNTEELRDRLIRVISEKNLNSQLRNDRNPTIPELVNILITTEIIPRHGRSEQSAEAIMELEDRAARGDKISYEEFYHGHYMTALLWIESELDDIEGHEGQVQ